MTTCCPICRGAASRPFGRWPDYTVWECGGCGFRFVDTTAPGYPKDAQYQYDEAQSVTVNPDQPHIRRRVGDILRFARAPGWALDIGCGKGEVSLLLHRAGFQCMGIDMKPRLIEHLQAAFPQVSWRCTMTAGLAALAERFDVLSMYHVLEHIPDPMGALAGVKSLANPEALIVIEVPNVAGWEARLKGRRWHYYKVDHVNYFRRRDLKRLARLCGLEVVGIKGYQHFSYPQDVLWKDWVKGALGWLGFQDVISIFLRVPA